MLKTLPTANNKSFINTFVWGPPTPTRLKDMTNHLWSLQLGPKGAKEYTRDQKAVSSHYDSASQKALNLVPLEKAIEINRAIDHLFNFVDLLAEAWDQFYWQPLHMTQASRIFSKLCTIGKGALVNNSLFLFLKYLSWGAQPTANRLGTTKAW